MVTQRSRSKTTEALAPRFAATMDGERLLSVFKSLVEPIGQSLPLTTEVVLHDLSLLPNSIVAIHGNVTGRSVGDPATDLLLEQLVHGNQDHRIGYSSRLPDGTQLRSATMLIRDIAGNAVAALCINSDISAWSVVEQVAQSFLGRSPELPLGSVGTASESFVKDLDELASIMIGKAIADVGVPVELMKKPHKIEVVRSLKSRGMFLLRDAVEMIAASLKVTRFTIYNYLNEIGDDADKSERKSG